MLIEKTLMKPFSKDTCLQYLTLCIYICKSILDTTVERKTITVLYADVVRYTSLIWKNINLFIFPRDYLH